MTPVRRLRVCATDGVCDDANPAGRSPRQVCIAEASSLAAHGVSPASSRANLVLDDGSGQLHPGALLTVGSVRLRVTLTCEPCAYGARLAGTPTRRFRNIVRWLAVVIDGGELLDGDEAVVTAGVFPAAPDGFRERCAWALDYVPPGRVVTNLEFLTAIGAGRSYARVLPRWLAPARTQGRPVHRVLTANLEPPSWAPDAPRWLANEGLDQGQLNAGRYALTQALWFS